MKMARHGFTGASNEVVPVPLALLDLRLDALAESWLRGPPVQ